MKRLRHYNKELAVVLSVFGSSEPAAMAQYEELKQEIKHSLPSEAEIRMAVSSRTVLKNLENKGQKFYTLPEELANIDRLGYKKVIVASINLFPTDEHEHLLKITEGFKNNISPARYEVTMPFFAKAKPTNEFLKALDNKLRQEHSPSSIVYIAHGSSNLCNTGSQTFLYVKEYLKMLNPNNYFFTIEGAFKYERVLIDIKGSVLVVPLLLVTGNHMLNDIYEIKEELDGQMPEDFSLLKLENTRKYFVDEVQEAIKRCSI
ncbi:MAG: hypothetical protein A2Y25_05065 [Candidatus Melainabacteria bacterium GWF2_37_15]|nr:MAG: hypothetical protein A2Y25_05065 [Candidatus Melainabacteria bacterium GWF2_37_15]